MRTQFDKICSVPVCCFPFTNLCSCGCVSVAGQDFEGDASIDVLQHLLQCRRIAAHLLAIQLPDDVARVQHALPVNHAAMENACDHKLAILHSECHALKRPHALNLIDFVCMHRNKHSPHSFGDHSFQHPHLINSTIPRQPFFLLVAKVQLTS